MQQEFEKIDFACGSTAVLENMAKLTAKRPFSDDTVAFLDALSKRLRENRSYKAMPDVAAFAFWCRRASVMQMSRSYAADSERRLGRGMTLHFAPSNIPVLFAFSMSAGLLAGNTCAVRLPSKVTPQATMLCDAINEVCENRFPEFKNRIAVFRYGHDRDITDILSKMCNVRVIWGGDSSVSEIRKSPLSPLATELPFADRKSAAVIDSEYVLNADELDDVFRRFYNDTYLNDQNACSSPRIVYWIGSENSVRNAQDRFWTGFYEYLKGKYELQPVTAMNKATAAAVISASVKGARIIGEDNLVIRVGIGELAPQLWNMTVPGGFFVECSGETLDGFMPALTAACQTVCCLGDIKQKLADKIETSGVSGGDRIVDFGSSLEFGLVWDGHDLIEAMSRRIVF